MAKAELGVKRLCLSCSIRFYDFKRSPIICPGCGAECDTRNPSKSRKNRAASKATTKLSTGVVGAEDVIDLDDDIGEDDDVISTSATVDDSDDVIDFDDDIDIDNDDGPGVIEDGLDDDDELLSDLRDDEDD